MARMVFASTLYQLLKLYKMGTQEIVAYIKLKLKRITEMQDVDTPNIGVIELLTELHQQGGESNYFRVQDALQEMANNGLVANRDKGIIFFNKSVLS